jgi:MFS family permease
LAESSLKRNLFYNLVVSAVMMTTLIAGPFYLTHRLHVAPGAMGLTMSAGPLTSIVSGLLSGIAVDRFGTRAVIAAGFGQLLVGALAFTILPARFGAAGFAVSAVLLSLGYQLFLSANSSQLMREALMERRGLVSGALSLSRNLGLIAGTSVLGSVFDLFGLETAFASAAVLIAISFMNHIIHEQRRKNGTRFPIQIY